MCSGVPTFCPFSAEFGKGLCFQDTFGEREYDAFFLIKMFPGRGDGAEQQLLRRLELLCRPL